ncbi:hypothetical protein FFI94_017715 [Rhodococcus sp. KBS0724]|uniref:hypothetical protein n=1 Tax=Rhodococcus sp. KBS0724 TaxID=1179674 RepID=UPI00110F456A|nr:hypothetical protein [Rhodococcus sp. KBS0724]TSD47786.1 hypothetical protein FFI94_017715 [Rhodococcus sp. KBS0724]
MPGTEERPPNDRRQRWTWRDTAFIAVVVLLGAGAARLTQDEGPAAIPGCESVQAARESEMVSITTIGGEDPGYNDPDYPWFSKSKAVAMREAVIEALPVDARREDPGFDFVFPAVRNFGEAGSTDTGEELTLGGSTTAHGDIARGDTRATISVDVREWIGAIPPCVEGSIDRREVRADGTVLDIYETKDAASPYAQDFVVAYVPGVSRVFASVTRFDGTSTQVLSTDELVDVALAPGFAVTEDVRSMTLCGILTVMEEDGVDWDVVSRLNAVLDDSWQSLGTSGVRLDRPLGSLSADGSGHGLCGDVVVTGPGAVANLQIVVTQNEFRMTGSGRIFPDGTLISRTEGSGTSSVTVARPSGETVVVRTVTRTTSPLVIEQLELIARSPGLEIVPS